MKRSWNFTYYFPLAMAAMLGYASVLSAQQSTPGAPAAEAEAEAEAPVPAADADAAVETEDPAPSANVDANVDAEAAPAVPPTQAAAEPVAPPTAEVEANAGDETPRANVDTDAPNPPAAVEERTPRDTNRRRGPNVDVDVDRDRRPAQRTGDRSGPRGAADIDLRFSRDLGVRYRAFPEGGFVITDLDDDSISARAGFRLGDRVLRVEDRMVRDWRDFRSIMSGYYGRRVPIYVIREERIVPVYIDLTEYERPAYLVNPDDPDREQRAGFGVNLTMVDGAVVVSHVYRDSPAALAGVRVGDVILNANDREVDNVDDVAGYIRTLMPGDDLVLHVRRQGENLRIASRLSTWNLAFDDAHPAELVPAITQNPPVIDYETHIANLEERIIRLEAAVRGLRKDISRYEPSTRTELTEPAERDIEIDAPAAPPATTVD